MIRFPGCVLLATSICLTSVWAETDQPDSAIRRADKLSSLTGRGAEPFRLKLSISEPANAQSPYSATVEEVWKSSTNWYRTIESTDFRQRIVVSDGKRDEQTVGSYYPIWLRSFVTAAINPLEDAQFWEQVSARLVVSTPTSSAPGTNCARAQFKVGRTALTNDAFVVICFNPDGTLSSVVRPGYDMEFHDLQAIGKKKIATRYVDDIEPGTELVGHVVLLEKLDSADASVLPPAFAVPSSGPIKSIPVKQETFESLAVASTAMVWPTVHSGNTSGKLSIYVSADRDGHVREAYPLNSDNAGLEDSAKAQLLKWQLRPALAGDERVQTEAALTFGFTTNLDSGESSNESPTLPASTPTETSTGKPIVITPVIANSLKIKSYAPVYPQRLKEGRVSGKVELTAVIGKQGRIVSLTPLSSNDPLFTEAAIAAVQQWTYKPYLVNGSPVEVQTILTVNFQAR